MADDMCIETINDWWNKVELHWAGIENLAYMFPDGFDASLLAPRDVTKEFNIPCASNIECMIWCRRKKNPGLVKFLDGIWNAAPEDKKIYDMPAWKVLTDLSMAAWVFDEVDAS